MCTLRIRNYIKLVCFELSLGVCVPVTVPVLSCEGLSLRVKATVHHSDQVMLTESSLC